MYLLRPTCVQEEQAPLPPQGQEQGQGQGQDGCAVVVGRPLSRECRERQVQEHSTYYGSLAISLLTYEPWLYLPWQEEEHSNQL